MLSFLQASDEERAHLALNFETVRNQTGVLSIFGQSPVFRNNGLAVLEIFPNSQVFNLHRNHVYKGKFASLLWKCLQNGTVPQLTPEDTTQKTDQFITSLNSVLEATVPKDINDQEKYHAMSIKKDPLVTDFVLDNDDHIIYLIALEILA